MNHSAYSCVFVRVSLSSSFASFVNCLGSLASICFAWDGLYVLGSVHQAMRSHLGDGSVVLGMEVVMVVSGTMA